MIYLILHGSFGYPDENWFPWLKLKLEKEGHKVYSPQLPIDDFDKLKPRDSPKQNLKAWLKSIEDIIKDVSDNKDVDFTIIAHSISPAFVLSLMEAYPELKLSKLVAVSPFLHYRDAEDYWQIRDVNDSFLKNDEAIISDEARLNSVKNRIKESLVIYGDNDPYVAPGESLEYAELLGSEVLVIKGGGHLNAEAGYTEFEELLSLI